LEALVAEPSSPRRPPDEGGDALGELEAAARMLADEIARLRAAGATSKSSGAPADGRSLYAAAEQAYHDRRRREAIVPAALLGEPAWDLLLDLVRARADERPLRITAACLGACAPPTTAVRYLRGLERAGLVLTSREQSDQRARCVSLTPAATDQLSAFFAASV
jgi:hypothetical protein